MQTKHYIPLETAKHWTAPEPEVVSPQSSISSTVTMAAAIAMFLSAAILSWAAWNPESAIYNDLVQIGYSIRSTIGI